MPDALNKAHIFEALDTFRQHYGRNFLIGLSGGSDSLALAHLCAEWGKGTDSRICTLSIDHGFRAASVQEAWEAQQKAAHLGLDAYVFTNKGTTPKSGLQNHARDLRLKAFAQRAFDMGGATILLGHTLDDQAETIAFRLARQTGLNGLCGMLPISLGLAVWEGQSYPIARPLLMVTRASLRAYLVEQGQVWIEDPSNQDTSYSRVKARARLAILGQKERLVRIGALAGKIRANIEQQADALELACSMDMGLKADAFLDAQQAVKACVLYRRLVASGAPNRPIKQEKIDALLRDMARDTFSGATLGGVKVSRNKGQFCFAKAPERRRAKKMAAQTEVVTHLG
jgi:tRNA(Ile)-lysidine synthase